MSVADPLPRRPRRPRRHRLVRRRLRCAGWSVSAYVDGRRPHRPRGARRRRGDRCTSPTSYPELGLTGPDDGRIAVTLHLVGRRTSTRRGPGRDRRGDRGAARRPTPRTAGPASSSTRTATAGCCRPPTRHRAPGPAPGRHRLPDPAGARRRPRPRLLRGGARLVDRGPGRVTDGWQVEGTTPMIGIGGGTRNPARCRCTPSTTSRSPSRRCAPPAASSGEIERQSFGQSALCRDDQGLPFWLGQLG